MLGFIAGRAGTGKTYTTLKKAVDEASDYKMTYIIVPEQSTLSYEKQLIEYNSESYRLGVEVLSFTRVVEKVMLETGGMAGNYIDAMGKIALVYRAIKDCTDALRLFGKYSDNPQFAVQFADTIDELKINNISPDELIKASEIKSINHTLRDKLYDAAIILKEYERLIRGSYFDPVDKLTALCEVLDGYNFFEGCAVYFDGFNGFSPVEKEVAKRIVKQSKNCVISLSAPSPECADELFYPIISLAEYFRKYADSCGIEIGETVILEENRKFVSEDMVSLEEALRTGKADFEGGEKITVYSATDHYDEMRFVAAEIHRLVREEGCRYKDIAVIAADLDSCRSAVEIEFQQYEIPYFIDSRSDVRFRPLMRLVLFALRVVSRGMFFEDMVDLAKTGLAGIDREEAAILENYVNLWRISGKKWEYEFNLNPRGFVEKRTEEDIATLERINSFRKRLAEPLIALREKIKKATVADEFAIALYEYLVQAKTPDSIKAEKKEALVRGEEYDGDRIWDLLMEAFDKISVAMSEEKMSVENYTELIKILFESVDVGVIPPHIDEVIIGSEGRVRVEHIKYCFIVGAIEGVFPNSSGRKGVFTNFDKEELLRHSIELIREDEIRRCEMLLSVYDAMTVPSEGVYISYSLTGKEDEYIAPSPVIAEMEEIFPRCRKLTASELSYEFLCCTPATVLNIGAEFYDLPVTSEQASVREAINRVPSIKEKMEEYSSVRKEGELPLDEDAARYLSGKARKLSATKSDEYYNCAYKFFCKYGLSLYPEPEAKFDSLTAGNFIHYLLQKTVEEIYSNNIRDDISSYVKLLAEGYINDVLGGEENLPKTFMNSVFRATRLVIDLIFNIKSELDESGYVPVDFEVEIEEGEKIEPWRILVGNGKNIKFTGKIDRVDVCTREGKNYLRIIDYKSNRTKKEFSLANVYDGIDVQMLVYLIAICLNGKSSYGNDIAPAGVYYFPARRALVDRDVDFNRKLTGEMSMSGMSLEDSPYDKRTNPKFYSASQLALIKKHIEHLFKEMHTNLRMGKIPKNPIETSKYTACERCQYSAICGVDTEKVTTRKIGKLKHGEVLEKLREEYDDEQ